jgi:hypothetical protein
MSNRQFYSLFFLASMLLVGIGYILDAQLHSAPHLVEYLVIQVLCALNCLSMIGIGLGLPIILIAAILGWGQLVLLMTGNVSPHFSEDGFFKVVGTLFKGI